MSRIPSPLPCTIRGKEYIISPLRFRDYIDFERYYHQRTLEAFGPAPIACSIGEVMANGYYSRACLAFQNSFDGGSYHLWLGLRASNKDLAYRDLLDLLDSDPEPWTALNEAKAVQTQVDYPPDPNPPKTEGDEKK